MAQVSQIEKQIQNKILIYLNDFLEDSFAFEIYNGGVPACARGSKIIYKKKGRFRPNGIPDLLWVYKGKTIFIETKVNGREGTKSYLKPHQKEIHQRIADCGGKVIVIRSLEEIRDYAASLGT